jgi:hypothetical protein
MTRFIFTLLIVFVSVIDATAQYPWEGLPEKPWNAEWITGPGQPINRWTASSDQSLKEYGVYKFRKVVELENKPDSFVVHVSGDNRYKLFVNGQLVVLGPTRGDLYFWNYETLDLAPYLEAGENTIAALVWNDGPYKPEAQITYLTGFILQGGTEETQVLNTNATWKTIEDASYQPLAVRVPGYYVAGPGELVDMNNHIVGWETEDFDDSGWVNARVIGPGVTKNFAINSSGWMLVPSPIPLMEMRMERLHATRRASGVAVPETFPKQKSPFVIPANTKATVLLDQGHLTNAYPSLEFSGGKGAALGLKYSEGLYIHTDEDLSGFRVPSMPKGNRDEVEGKIVIGKNDSIVSNGGQNQKYTPLWWRTYRYLELTVETKDEPITIEDIYGTFTGYPFTQNASLQAENRELDKIMEIGWRTARLCAFETYMDCPYYEQLQYIGDARIQALVSYYNAGDDQLAKYALDLMDHSRIPEGITLSRYPTDLDQQITTFSLWYIAMLHDYFRYRQDHDFIRHKLPGARAILSFFENFQQDDGSLRNLPYWVFTDWANGDGWNFGMAPKGNQGESAILDLQLLWVYQMAGDLEDALGMKDFAEYYRQKAAQLKNTIRQKYWDPERMIFTDTGENTYFSQHTNSLAILAEVVTGEDAHKLGIRLLEDESMVQASIYFKFYLHQALVKSGFGNDYLKWLDVWRENIAMGLTTWAETSDVSGARSDSHAWGSSPNIEFYRTLLGIDSDAPGFSRVKITPHLGDIKQIAGTMPHPNGEISVSYEQADNKLDATIELPENTDGHLVWNGKEYPLKSGVNTLKL